MQMGHSSESSAAELLSTARLRIIWMPQLTSPPTMETVVVALVCEIVTAVDGGGFGVEGV